MSWMMSVQMESSEFTEDMIVGGLMDTNTNLLLSHHSFTNSLIYAADWLILIEYVLLIGSTEE